MRKLAQSVVVAVTLAIYPLAGCGEDAPSCDQVVDNTLKLMPAEMAGAAGDRGAMLQQCKEKLSKEERKCAASAKSLEELMKCKRG
jgi:hypothetical protein